MSLSRVLISCIYGLARYLIYSLFKLEITGCLISMISLLQNTCLGHPLLWWAHMCCFLWFLPWKKLSIFVFFFWNYMRLLMPKFYPFKYLREEHLSNYIYLKEWCLLQSHLEKEKIIFTQLFYIIEKEIDPHNTFMGRFELLPLQAYQTNNLNDPFICWK